MSNFAPGEQGGAVLEEICMMRNYLLLIYICLTALAAYGGTGVSHKPGHRIGGRVIDAKSGEPIAFATVVLPDAGLWAITDEEGVFAIEGLSSGTAVLNVKYIGYEDLTVKIDVSRNVSGIVLKLQESSLALDEVVVPAGIESYDPQHDGISIFGNMLDWTVSINCGDKTVHYALNASDYSLIDKYVIDNSSRRNFGLRFTSVADKYVKPRFY